MGKGDKKSKRGKIIMGSYGVRRQKKSITTNAHSIVQKAIETKAKATPKPKEKEVVELKVEAIVEKKPKTTVEKKTKIASETKTKTTGKKTANKENNAE